MIKIPVKDKYLIQCNENETRVVQPKALQDDLDIVMKKYDSARCFVRPSGTEDVVRIYAEAASLDNVKELLKAATDAVNKHVG